LAITVVLPILALPCRAVPQSEAGDSKQATAGRRPAGKADLLQRIEALEAKLPPELARQLIIISMKIATGWCSPHLAEAFETEVGKLPERERKGFEAEWKAVREHDFWPTVIVRKQSGSSTSKK
jgi:hypothetical protein